WCVYFDAVSDVGDFAENLLLFSKGLTTIWADRNWIPGVQPRAGDINESLKAIFWISGPIREVISHRVEVRTGNMPYMGNTRLSASDSPQLHSYRSPGLRRSKREISRSRSSGQR